MTVKINSKFVKTLLAEREETLRDVAARSDIGEATLYRILNGAEFNSRTLGKLAEALECSPADLLSNEGYHPPLVGAQAARIPQTALTAV